MKYLDCFKKSIIAQIVLIIAFVAVVCLPSLFAEFSKIDDVEMLTNLQNIKKFSLLSIFVPQTGGGLYFRPIILISFSIDRFILSLNPISMHAHNVILHIANTSLVYFIVDILIKREDKIKSLLPFGVALLFGFHPLSTESVNWVSGRTDLLSGFFLLCATICLLHFIENRIRSIGYATIVLILLAVLTKEFALAYLPGVALLLIVKHSKQAGINDLDKNLFRMLMFFLFITIFVVASFFFLRSIAFTSNSSRIVMTLKFFTLDPFRTFKVFAGAFAFYLKKIFIPYPLNFAIVQIDPLYELLSIPILFIFLRVLFTRSIEAVMFVIGVLMYSPAFIIAFNQIAWTPYAERYAYLSTAFIIIGSSLYFERRWEGRFNPYKTIFICFLILIFMGTTYARNITWQSNLSLMADTIEKSPYAAEPRLLYGSLLAERGDHVEALLELEYGKKLPGLGYDERFDLNIADIYAKEHKFDKAIMVLEIGLSESKGKSVLITKELIKLLTHNLLVENNDFAYKILVMRIIDLRLALYKLNPDVVQPAIISSLALRIAADRL
jgi:hypothetical protein